ncbi:hypothetical protein Y032_0008g176 [Ancylostoma ceylanicum]|uniref:Uncharacterized protein n=1 Tax=Ancylostoma ceylanicum TaxID=53326 RepID=A0A016VJH9_9BILA|nr:hypothetical protein Y032_0008g176 [Ancylostoma ceylanicum]
MQWRERSGVSLEWPHLSVRVTGFRPGTPLFTSGMEPLSSTTATLTLMHQLALVIGEGIVIWPIRNSTESE